MRVATSVTVAAALVLGGIVVSADAAAPATPTWSVVPSPNRTARVGASAGAILGGVACRTITSCVVVGNFTNDHPLPLAGHSRDTTWSVAAAPRPGAAPEAAGDLSSVACVARDRCFGVGYFDRGTGTHSLIDRWNGKVWSIVPSPTPPNSLESGLAGIACPTASSCFAVGFVVRSGPAKTLIMHWNGTTWSIVTSADPAGGGRLSGISCASNSSCVAVGATNAPNRRTLVEHWDGTTWKVMPSKNRVGAADNELTAVSCPFGRACFAVGSSRRRNGDESVELVERWDGDIWRIVATPGSSHTDVGEGSALGGVTCLSLTACFAVGYSTTNFQRAPSVERWDGKSWSAVPIDDPNEFTNESLAGISCVSTTSCIAVGTSFYGTLIEQWDGTRWSEIPKGGSASHLNDISCPSTTTCFAVGGSGSSFPFAVDNRGLIERWDGTAWRIVASPDVVTPRGFAELSSISCATTTSCFAVGAFGDGVSTARILIERWDGTRWTRVDLSDPPGVDLDGFVGVSCPSPTSCFAVGNGSTTDEANRAVPFVARWNGTSWTAEVFPNAADGSVPFLRGIDCASPSACTAVGGFGDFGERATAAARWDGAAWTVVPSPNVAGVANKLASVTCPAADRCYAVGNTFDFRDATGRTLVEEWNGTAWSIVPSPNPSGAFDSRLFGVSCKKSADCIAVGASFGRFAAALTMHWDGNTWTLVRAARPAAVRETALSDVTCGSGTCSAVGQFETGTARKTLVERSS